MKTRLLSNLSVLTLAVLASAGAHADERDTTLAWQQPGYVLEVVVATTPRPSTITGLGSTDRATPALQQAEPVQEVVVVRASRSEVLAAAGWSERPISPLRLAFMAHRRN